MPDPPKISGKSHHQRRQNRVPPGASSLTTSECLSLFAFIALSARSGFSCLRDPVVVTLTEWEAELRKMRVELGPTRQMRLRWYSKKHVESGAAGWSILAGDGIGETLVLALYDDHASPGDRPRAEVEVESNTMITDVPQGSVVEVAGLPEPGHAVVVLIGDAQHWPTYPAGLSLRAPKL
jgi:hypothetical protein